LILDDLQKLETIASALIQSFDIQAPPIPIESMLQHPQPDMWEEVDLRTLSFGFSVREPFAPRMSLARLLARHVIESEWGKARDLKPMIDSDARLYAFARMLVMPIDMVRGLSSGARNPTAMSFHFEVPEDDARQRLLDIARYGS
jgi:hypothetical protein